MALVPSRPRRPHFALYLLPLFVLNPLERLVVSFFPLVSSPEWLSRRLAEWLRRHSRTFVAMPIGCGPPAAWPGPALPRVSR